jgi:NAD(P)H-dependent FMN reductase
MQTDESGIPTDTPLTLMIVIASTRPVRVGLPVGEWFHGYAADDGRFTLDLADLAEINLPLMDEPQHPRLHQYTHQHTKDWSARVEAADAFVFITPEYNHGMTAPLKNAIDYLSQEWRYKPVGFVSYGGVSGGIRAVQMLKQVVSILRMVPIADSLPIPFVQQFVQDGHFNPTDIHETAAAAILEELERLAIALRPLRSNA